MSRLKQQQVQRQELLPGIHDDVTLNLITTKLPWSAVWKLALVSRGWREMIQSREVYNARVRSNSMETLIFTDFEVGRSSSIGPRDKQYFAIYSSRDRCFYSLPSIPDNPEGSLVGSGLVSLDGKLYVLGGEIEPTDGDSVISKKVYVLDLVVGQRQWNQVASMPAPRSCFAADVACFTADVADGKIYALGGLSCEGFAVLQVYDPEVNAWTIEPVHDSGPNIIAASSYDSHELLTAEEGLCVFGTRLTCLRRQGRGQLKIYHPGRNDWRQVDHFSRGTNEVIFVVEGKLHSISRCSVNVYNIAKNCWTLLHSFSFEEEYFEVWSVVAVDNELLAKVHRGTYDMEPEEFFIQSRGFGSENERITWDEVCSTLFYNPCAPMFLVEL